MIHKMKLYPSSYEKVKNQSKTIEMRLCDDKRKIVQIGDKIEFVNTENKEILYCKVINIYKYASFEELYNSHDKIAIGYEENEEANPNDMLMYYTKENIAKYGVLGIEVKLCESK